MNKYDFMRRTRNFAVAILRLSDTLPKSRAADVLGRQLLRAGTSVAAHYGSACRARSRADFIAKVGVVEEEADEVGFWLELLMEHGLIQVEQAKDLLRESHELLAITVASIRTARHARRSIRNPQSAIRNRTP